MAAADIFTGLADWGTFGQGIRGSMPCPSDFVPDDDGFDVTEWDLADHVDAALTALTTVQQVLVKLADPHMPHAERQASYERMQGLLNTAREALDEAPL